MAHLGFLKMDPALEEPPSGVSDQGASRPFRRMVQSEDSRLIAEILAGNPAAFEFLVRPYLGLFTNGIHRILQDVHETQEALQEALLSIHSELHLFLARTHFCTWAYRLCLDEALMRRRARMRQTDDGIVPFRLGLADLSEDQKVVFVLRNLEGLDTDTVARKLGISRRLVRERLHQALVSIGREYAPNRVTA